MRRFTTVALAGLAILVISACGAPSEDLREIQEQQALIIEKLTKLEQQLQAARPAARPKRPQEDYTKVYAISYAGATIKGNPNAPVTLTEWSDFECPFCAKVAVPIGELLEKYPEKLRIVYKHFPLNFHKSARPAAVASLAAKDQNCFWKYHDVLFEKTSKRQLKSADLEDYAATAGCDVERFKKDLEANAKKYNEMVDADYREGTAADVRGTPALYINGRKVRDRSVEGMSAMVEAAAKEAAGGE